MILNYVFLLANIFLNHHTQPSLSQPADYDPGLSVFVTPAKRMSISKPVVNSSLTNTHRTSYPLISIWNMSNQLLINIVNHLKLYVLYYMWSTLLILADRSTFTCVLWYARIRNSNVWRLICMVRLPIMKLSSLITYWLYNYFLFLKQIKHTNLGLELMKYNNITWYWI